MAKYFVAFAGNIGVGKSTLVALLAAKIGWEPFFEIFKENPYLADFYINMPQWGFHSQVFFLTRRLQQHHQLLQHLGSVLQDRTIYEDADVFARNLYLQGYMTERDWQTYYELYSVLSLFLRPPDLIVYLRASTSTLLRRISQRGREYEVSISDEYLTSLNTLYDDWISKFVLCPVLTVATDNLDYLQQGEHLDQIAQRIYDRLHGKEFLELE